MSITEIIKNTALSLGASEVGFSRLCTCAAGFPGLDNAVTVAVRLSSAVVSGIADAPTHTYFHHYRTVNAFIDSVCLKIGMTIESEGLLYACVPASQTVDRAAFSGLVSHKAAAVAAGLGTIGKSSLFISDKFGPAVRLGTVLTNAELSDGYSQNSPRDVCGGCDICMRSCPAMAISGDSFDPAQPEKALVDRRACSEFMKKEFQLIGRGSVCGICIRSCPKFLAQLRGLTQ